MNSQLRACALALLLGGAALPISGLLLPAPASAAGLKITDKAVGVPMQDAQKAAAQGHFKEAIDLLHKAEAASKDHAVTTVIHQMILGYALQAKDTATAIATVDRMLASGEGDKSKNLQTGLGLALQMKNTQKAAEYQKQLGGNSAIYLAQAYYQAGNYQELIRTAKTLLQNGQPSQDLLQLLAASYAKVGDEAGRRSTQELLVQNYPKPEYWHDLIRMAHNQKALSDEEDYELYRLRLAVGDMKTGEDYSEMAQIGLQLGYPAEAKAVLNKALTEKLLSGERLQRLVTLVDKTLAADTAALGKLQADADSDSTGTAYLKLGGALYTRGQGKEAEAAIRKAIAKDKLKNPDMAKIALGHALSSQGKKQEAVAAFNSVPKANKDYSVARLWAIYAQRS